MHPMSQSMERENLKAVSNLESVHSSMEFYGWKTESTVYFKNHFKNTRFINFVLFFFVMLNPSSISFKLFLELSSQTEQAYLYLSETFVACWTRIWK